MSDHEPCPFCGEGQRVIYLNPPRHAWLVLFEAKHREIREIIANNEPLPDPREFWGELWEGNA